MGTHMKTTVDISDSLLRAAKAVAAKEGTTLRSLFEEGLRYVVQARENGVAFRLTDESVDGAGLQSPLLEGDWSTIRGLAYEGHGG